MATESAAQTIRRAARVMRDRAEATTRNTVNDEGIWTLQRWYGPTAMSSRRVASEADSAFISSWSPDLALAVAAWLDDEADWQGRPSGPVRLSEHNPALRVARAYLDEVAP